MSTLPNIGHPVWDKLVTGQIKHKFTLFAANMAVDRVTRAYVVDNNAKPDLVKELYEFFKKYESVTENDLASLS